ncbi:MAG: hypothetical protein CMF80_01595 [Candidatus Marinimicrobia bacterium]|nr:hypothetical protein [Candidatus Neomarinimicrobiota bacterium]
MLIVIFILSTFIFASESSFYNTFILSKKNMIGMPLKIFTTIECNDSLKLFDINITSKNDYDLDTIFINKDTIIQEITVWNDHGIYISPHMTVYLSNNDILVDSIIVTGIEFLVDSTNLILNDIKDNKGLRNIDNKSYIAYAMYIIIIILVLIYVNFIKNKDIKHKNKYTKKKLYQYKDAIYDIEKLDLSNSNSDIIKNYLNLSVILRKYLSTRFFINTEKMTSKEIFLFFEKNIHDKKIIKKLKTLFNEIDIIKYSNDTRNIIDKQEIVVLLNQIKNYKNI